MASKSTTTTEDDKIRRWVEQEEFARRYQHEGADGSDGTSLKVVSR